MHGATFRRLTGRSRIVHACTVQKHDFSLVVYQGNFVPLQHTVDDLALGKGHFHIYELYRYVPRDGVWFLKFSILK